jgi:hypothetical protein
MNSLKPEITCSLPDGDRELLLAVPFKNPIRVEFSSGKFPCRFLNVGLFLGEVEVHSPLRGEKQEGWKVGKAAFPSFRRKPESSLFTGLQNTWTPVFTGVTTFYEAVIIPPF